MNKVWLSGNLTKDAELSFTPGKGTAVCKFNIAVRRDKENTDFIQCVAFSKTAETIAQYFAKGSKIALVGSIKTGSYEAKDGTRRYTTDVWVESFEFVDSKKKEQAEIPVDFNNKELGEPVDDGDIPF